MKYLKGILGVTSVQYANDNDNIHFTYIRRNQLFSKHNFYLIVESRFLKVESVHLLFIYKSSEAGNLKSVILSPNAWNNVWETITQIYNGSLYFLF